LLSITRDGIKLSKVVEHVGNVNAVEIVSISSVLRRE
jgi:hypothetical protein